MYHYFYIRAVCLYIGGFVESIVGNELLRALHPRPPRVHRRSAHCCAWRWFLYARRWFLVLRWHNERSTNPTLYGTRTERHRRLSSRNAGCAIFCHLSWHQLGCICQCHDIRTLAAATSCTDYTSVGLLGELLGCAIGLRVPHCWSIAFYGARGLRGHLPTARYMGLLGFARRR